MSPIFLPANSSGRSKGVFASSLVVKLPEMSGSPHGRRFGTNLRAAAAPLPFALDVFAAGAAFEDEGCVWPAVAGTAIARVVRATPNPLQHRVNMSLPPNCQASEHLL